jgi:hypothetical protein
MDFTLLLRRAVEKILLLLKAPMHFRGLNDSNAHVFNLLRGGLNFGLREALYNAYGLVDTSSSFMTSERRRTQEGRWEIAEDQYQKFSLPKDATIFCGDITATGSTAVNGLLRLATVAKNSGLPIRRFVFFTIGCHKAEKVLEQVHTFCRGAFRGYDKTILVYIEGKFHLADSRTDVSIKIQGTDLLRHPALLAPEFLRSQFDSVTAPMERCAIYDGGTRSFNVVDYVEDVAGYWRQVARLAGRGVTLKDYLEERFPTGSWRLGRRAFAEYLGKSYPYLNSSVIREIHDAGNEFRKKYFTGNGDLKAVCEQMLESLSNSY